MTDDELLFFDEDEAKAEASALPAQAGWKILIVDDEPEVHAVTRLALRDLKFEGRGLEWISAYSGKDGRQRLAEHADIALILLDVVMETDDAGLLFARHVREEALRPLPRIVLRTGQPGQAPEQSVILGFDINDYKTKTELTAQRLSTTVITALRAYRDLSRLEHHRHSLSKILETTTAALQQRGTLITRSLRVLEELVAPHQPESVRAAVLRVASDGGTTLLGGRLALNDGEVDRAIAAAHSVIDGVSAAIYSPLPGNGGVMLSVTSTVSISEDQQHILEVFAAKLAAEMHSQELLDQLHLTQEATILSLARLAEYKDTDTGDHLRRVEDGARGIARELHRQGMFADVVDDAFVDEIGAASILHDIGKVGIPEKVLMKPGPLDDDEWVIMRSHVTIGGAILGDAARLVGGRNFLSLAADIALGHHEKFAGGGYPLGIAGEAIPLAARIVALVDVYDALTSKRPYKEPWPQEKALALIRAESGKHFDPRLVAAFLTWLPSQTAP